MESGKWNLEMRNGIYTEWHLSATVVCPTYRTISKCFYMNLNFYVITRMNAIFHNAVLTYNTVAHGLVPIENFRALFLRTVLALQ